MLKYCERREKGRDGFQAEVIVVDASEERKGRCDFYQSKSASTELTAQVNFSRRVFEKILLRGTSCSLHHLTEIRGSM